jgi:hypothetical protein
MGRAAAQESAVKKSHPLVSQRMRIVVTMATDEIE